MIEQIRLTLPKIGCQGCMKKVVSALGTVPGVEVVETEVPSKTILLRYEDTQARIEQIEGTLQGIGHVISKWERTSGGATSPLTSV
jgi:copper chaperone CopZ